MCSHVNQSFSYSWTNSAALSFYSRVSRQRAEKAAVMLILESQRYRQQQALQITWPDAQNWQNQEDSDWVTLAYYAWDAPSSATVPLHRKGGLYTTVTVITYAKDSCIACPAHLSLLHLPLWDHRAAERSVSQLVCLEQPSKKFHFSYSRDEPWHYHCHVANGPLSPCVTCYVRSHKLVQKNNEVPVSTVSTNADGNWEYTRNLCLLSV